MHSLISASFEGEVSQPLDDIMLPKILWLVIFAKLRVLCRKLLSYLYQPARRHRSRKQKQYATTWTRRRTMQSDSSRIRLSSLNVKFTSVPSFAQLIAQY